jgi:hypothetical protein
VINLAYDADGIRVGKTFFDPTGALVRSTSYLVDTNNLTGYAQVLEEKTAEATWILRHCTGMGMGVETLFSIMIPVETSPCLRLQ